MAQDDGVDLRREVSAKGSISQVPLCMPCENWRLQQFHPRRRTGDRRTPLDHDRDLRVLSDWMGIEVAAMNNVVVALRSICRNSRVASMRARAAVTLTSHCILELRRSETSIGLPRLFAQGGYRFFDSAKRVPGRTHGCGVCASCPGGRARCRLRSSCMAATSIASCRSQIKVIDFDA